MIKIRRVVMRCDGFRSLYQSAHLLMYAASKEQRSDLNQTIKFNEPGTNISINGHNKHFDNMEEKEKSPRKYWAHFKKKRDKGGGVSRADIFTLEVDDAIKTFNKRNGTDIAIKNILIPRLLAENDSVDMKTILQNVEIIYHTSAGDGLAFVRRDTYVEQDKEDKNAFPLFTIVRVPKTIPGDIATIKLGRHLHFHAEGVLLKIENSRSRLTRRRDRLVVCQKFNECSGCQLQMLSNDDQLKYKQEMLQRAFVFFYPQLLTEVSNSISFGPIIESPMQYSYRTKITPHFEIRRNVQPLDTNIGFNNLSDPVRTIDVDYCPIATAPLNKALPGMKSKVRQMLEETQANKMLFKDRIKAKIDLTLLLRDSIRIHNDTGEYEHVCITEPKKVITEKIEEFVFQFESSEFFQVNSSILPLVLDYIRYHIRDSKVPFKYIVDSYCGSGFFGIALSKEVPEGGGKIFGIEISEKSIKYAKHNAKINGLNVPEKIDFISGNSDQLFENEKFISSNIVGKDSILIMDPSRKGSTQVFLKQLLDFGPTMVIYISCNPFSQARDLSTLNELQKSSNIKYRVKDISGFDFFPQTKHVESVAILERI